MLNIMSRPNIPPPKTTPVALPPKPRTEKHWSQTIQETVVSAVPEDSHGISISGGADNGLFCFISDIRQDQLTYYSGKLYAEDIVLEIQGQKIAGYTLRDATIWLKQVSQNGTPVMIKTVRTGQLPRDLRQFLTSRFQKGSVDHDLQQTIRDNLYLRTVPCTTRSPRPGEVNGVDYTFLSLEEFIALEKTGCLLESGLYDGNHYGTPKPPSEPKGQVIRRSSSIGAVLPGAHPSSDGKRRRNRSNTEGGSSKSSPVPFQDERNRKMSLEKAQSESSLGILPANWEKAFTDEGTPYFIDHSTETTHWLDPRLAHLQKQQPQDCDDGELPFGWEKVEDPHYGTYYIDHVNRKTQYENPVTQAKRINQGNDLNSTLPRTKKSQDSAKRSASDSNMNGRGAPPDYSRHHGKGIRVKKEKRIFTKNPSELKGENIQTTLVKSVRGFGFTIIGGDHTDEEFLQIKKVVENGPAHQDGTLKTGDVLVNVDDRCVLGYSHQDIVNLFQTIPPNQSVTLTINRGYTLPFDPDDPNTEIIVTLAVTLPSGSNTNQSPPSYSSIHDNHGNMDQHNTSAKSLKSLPDLTRSANLNSHSIVSQQKNGNTYNSSDAPDLLGLYQKPETISINIVRGEMGFGFTIADSAYGQRVKQILDKGRCKTLQEGDILQEINHVNVREMSHTQIVQVLKDCPKGVETEIVIQRGGIPQRVKKPSKSPRPMDDSKSFPASDTSFGSNNQPGQYFFDANHSNAADKSESISKENSDQDIQEKCDNKDMVDGPEPITRPKTPTSTDARPKTPSFNDSRPKTPTRIAGMNVNDSRGKPPLGGRPPVPEMQNMKISDPHAPRREYVPQEDQYNKDYGSQDLNQSRGSSEFYQNVGNFDVNSRPPPGPRYDQFRNDHGQRPYGRQDSGGHVRQNHTMHNFHDRESRYDHNRGETAKPGMFRSRTPGPELLSRGPDYRNEFQRPKTPTAQEMRSKTPVPGQSFGYSSSANPDFLPGRYQNSFGANGHRQGPSQRSWGPRSPDFPVSPPPLRRGDHFDSSDNRNNIKPFSQAGPGRPPRQSTSFEDVDPTPSNITRVPKRFPLHPNSSLNSQIQQSPRLPPRFHDREEPVRTVEFNITLQKQENGFGFRIIGGTEEGSQVSVGHIVPNGAADLDGRLRTGDEITHVDNMSVINSSHHRVVQMMGLAGQQGHVTLGVRRRVLGGTTDSGYNSTGMQDTYPYDITVTRRETEGFGFVIISSVSKSGSVIGECIGRILENSPAERCGRLQIGDRILAVNGVDISHMLHEDIVNLIKDSGYSVTLTVGPPQDDASSTASNSQRSSQGSMVNAMAYPAVGENEIRRFPPPVPVERNFKDMNRQRSVSNHQSSPEDAEYYNVELSRGSRGFGFSIRGGQEFNCMPLFVLRIAEGGSADLDGRLRVGDQILEINGYKTDMMTHSDAIDIIQNGGQTVRLLIKRTGKLPPAFENNAISGRYPPPNMPMSNGPIGQSSPYLGRRNIEHREDPNFYYNQGGRQYTGY